MIQNNTLCNIILFLQIIILAILVFSSTYVFFLLQIIYIWTLSFYSPLESNSKPLCQRYISTTFIGGYFTPNNNDGRKRYYLKTYQLSTIALQTNNPLTFKILFSLRNRMFLHNTNSYRYITLNTLLLISLRFCRFPSYSFQLSALQCQNQVQSN